MAKVLLIAPTCNGDDVGEAWVAYQWARRLAERHELTLLTYRKRKARSAREQLPAVRVVEWVEPPLLGRAERFNSIVKPGYVPFYFKARRWIRQAIAAGESFDVAHQPVPVAMRYPSPAAGLPVPLVIGPVGGSLASPPGFADDEGSAPWFMSLRGFDQARLRLDPVLRSSFEQADRVLGIADYTRELLAPLRLRSFEVMSETGLDALPPPIDRSDRDGTLRLLFVGRLVRTKGCRDAIRAMSLVKDLDVRLDIVGEGPERAPCTELIDRHGLASRVTLHGWRSKAEVAGFYDLADVFVFPSYREAGGNVALEAMGYSLPLVVVDRGGPGSATSSDCAFKLKAENPQGLAEEIALAVRRLATDKALRLRMGQASREHVARTALWSAKLDRIDRIYDEVRQQEKRVPGAAATAAG